MMVQKRMYELYEYFDSTYTQLSYTIPLQPGFSITRLKTTGA
jgi:hypothetical protein